MVSFVSKGAIPVKPRTYVNVGISFFKKGKRLLIGWKLPTINWMLKAVLYLNCDVPSWLIKDEKASAATGHLQNVCLDSCSSITGSGL